MKNLRPLILGAFLIAISAPASHAGNCWVDDETESGNSHGGSITTSGDPFFGTICGRTVHGTGTGGCTITFEHDATASANADCLTLGEGVTIEGDGHNIDCPSGSCGSAVRILNYSGNGNTNVQNLSITGCFSHGVRGQTNTSNNATDLQIDLLGSGCQGGVGVSGMSKAEGVFVANASNYGIDASTVRDVQVRSSYRGLMARSGHVFDNVTLHDNNYGIDPYSSGAATSMASSSVVNSSVCACGKTVGATTTCYGISTCVSSFIGDPSWIDDELHQ